MKKITAIICSICICIMLMPFSVVKAQSAAMGSGIVDNSDPHFSWQWQDITAGSNEYVDLSNYGVETTVFKSVSIINIQFEDYVSGSFGITYQSDNNFEYVTVIGNAQIVSKDTVNSKYKISLNLINCQSLTVIRATTVANRTSGGPYTWSSAGIETGFQISLSADMPMDYMIPVECVPGYLWLLNNGTTVQYESGDIYPYINVSNGDMSRQISIAGNRTYTLLVYSDTNLYQSSTNYYFHSSNSSVVPTLTNIGYNFNGWRLQRIEFKNTTSSNKSFNMVFDGNFKIIPLFFGSKDQMPDYIRSLAGYTNRSDEILEMLAEILALVGDDGSTGDDMEDAASDISDITSQEDDIISGFTSDLTDFSTDVDLDDYNFVSGLGNASEYFKTQIDLVFTQSGAAKAFWVIPVILIVLTALLGR